MRVVAEHALDLRDSDQAVRARVYEPVREPDGDSWTAWVEIGAPFSCRWPAGGVTDLQALIMALRLCSQSWSTAPRAIRKGSWAATAGSAAISACRPSTSTWMQRCIGSEPRGRRRA